MCCRHLQYFFQFETGVRIGELCVLRFEDVHGDYIRVQRMFRGITERSSLTQKGSYGDRDVILTREARHIIDTCRTYRLEQGLPDEGYIFSVDKEPCSYYAISDLYRKYCRKMGIQMKSSHKARKTVISALIDGNVNINSVRGKWLDIGTSERLMRTTFMTGVLLKRRSVWSRKRSKVGWYSWV